MMALDDGAGGQGSGRGRRSRRARKRVRYVDVSNDAEDEHLEQQHLLAALALSRKVQKRGSSLDLPECPVLSPTEEEFRDVVGFLKRAYREARRFGICKIRPPPGWSPPQQSFPAASFPTKLQDLRHLPEGQPFGTGLRYTPETYASMAADERRAWLDKHHPGLPDARFTGLAVEQDFWDIVEAEKDDLTVEYANDLDIALYGSGFPPPRPDRDASGRADGVPLSSSAFYAASGWNLQNLPFLEGMATQHISEPVNGINVPWLYRGALFAAFAMHTEDNHLASANYLHSGASKTWYGVGYEHFDAVLDALRSYAPTSFSEQPDLHMALTTLLPPSVLVSHGIRVSHTIQQAGEFVITFPGAYHGGFSHGANIAEAVNFATYEWFPIGRRCIRSYREIGRRSAITHDLVTLRAAASLPRSASPKEVDLVARDLHAVYSATVEAVVRAKRARLKVEASPGARGLAAALSEAERRTCAVCDQLAVTMSVHCPCGSFVVCPYHMGATMRCTRTLCFSFSTAVVWHDVDALWDALAQWPGDGRHRHPQHDEARVVSAPSDAAARPDPSTHAPRRRRSAAQSSSAGLLVRRAPVAAGRTTAPATGTVLLDGAAPSATQALASRVQRTRKLRPEPAETPRQALERASPGESLEKATPDLTGSGPSKEVGCGMCGIWVAGASLLCPTCIDWGKSCGRDLFQAACASILSEQ